MKKILLSICFLTIATLSFSETHLDKYPNIGQMFNWGMNIEEIETILDQKLINIGQNKYQINFTSNEVDYHATFIVSNSRLNALVLRSRMSPKEYSFHLDNLIQIYGKPTGTNPAQKAVQWKDDSNDTGIVVTEEKEGLYTFIAALRLLDKNNIPPDDLNPRKISSLESIYLGMSKDDFLNSNKFFEAKKLPKEESLPANTEIYQAILTINIIPSEVFFEFNDDILTYAMIYIPIESKDESSKNKEFENHFRFLANLYGSPSQQVPSRVLWSDNTIDLQFGLHPFGIFVISWEFTNQTDVASDSTTFSINQIPTFQGLKFGISPEELNQNFKGHSPLELLEDTNNEMYTAYTSFNSRPSTVYFGMHNNLLAMILLELNATETTEDNIKNNFQNHMNYLTNFLGKPSEPSKLLAIWELNNIDVAFTWVNDSQRFQLVIRDKNLLAQ